MVGCFAAGSASEDVLILIVADKFGVSGLGV